MDHVSRDEVRALATEFLICEVARSVIEAAEAAKNGFYTDSYNTQINSAWIEYHNYSIQRGKASVKVLCCAGLARVE